MAIIKVDLQKSYRILNPGATTLVSAKHGEDANAMAITWAQALDYDKLTIIPHNGSYTRTLIEKSGYFAVQIPVATQAELVSELGAEDNSRFDNPHKMDSVKLFYKDGFDVPLIEGCAAWIICKQISEPHNEQTYDLFIGQVVAAYADDRIFDGGHWKFESVPDELKTLHYVAGGQYYLDGKAINTKRNPIVE
ncbi:flavin reductase family protein [Campylobacter sp. RM9344]|uniref:Flavin reductase family protein n=1 Tax=Campylobacter californiensis TaxID=1032243 RepID=A0AAW3ZWI1_9BACT|nr:MULTISPECIES: flavin reductase family protein [unclassified Campylobacter]MBE2984968.1 flavin reductase family protein [Campylobacter sp. RM6883]MBE2995410.1 flavin reductase family protein [Campylobacter sp. RM6913]MBE3030334.1 flavin reductase family protein [Campylobacter sp. RM9344]MBE3608611.1 flavin reductase family protein [Campylobacter sp. RM9337]QCD49967.1 flavin reductase (DIM6/NTAB) family protein [Campylobacter sp. RM6914]